MNFNDFCEILRTQVDAPELIFVSNQNRSDVTSSGYLTQQGVLEPIGKITISLIDDTDFTFQFVYSDNGVISTGESIIKFDAEFWSKLRNRLFDNFILIFKERLAPMWSAENGDSITIETDHTMRIAKVTGKVKNKNVSIKILYRRIPVVNCYVIAYDQLWKTIANEMGYESVANNGVSIGYVVKQRSIPIEQEELRKRLTLNIPVGTIINEELIEKVTQVVQEYVQEVEDAIQKETL